MYFVVDPASGQKFGPADVETLNRWVLEGRLTPASMFEDASTGQQMTAAQVPGLNMGGTPQAAAADPMIQQPKPAAPQMPPMGESYSGPNRPYGGSFNNPPTGYVAANAGAEDMKKAWIWLVVGFFCCPLIGAIVSMNYSNKAKQAGNPSAQTAFILAIILIVLGVIGIIYNISVFTSAMNSARATP